MQPDSRWGRKNMKTRVLYHASCPDGFASAWAIWRRFGDAYDYEPWQYGQDPPVVDSKTTLILVDFSFKRQEMEKLIASSHSLLCLDHHKTSEAELKGLRGCYFDMNRSGASMAWDFFHGDHAPRPWLIDYVQDRDLWTWKLPNSKEVSAWVMAQPHLFEAWNSLLEEGLEIAIKLGCAIRIHIGHYCEHYLKHVRTGSIGMMKMAIVNAPMFNVSDLLHTVCESSGLPACAWWQRGDGKLQYSLRSIGDTDVSEIARAFGGGGHKNAAGFESNGCAHAFD